MTAAGWAQLVALIVVLGVTAPLLGRYMANVYDGRAVAARPGLRAGRAADLPRAAGSIREREQRWNVYALSLLGVQPRRRSSLLYVMQRVQGGLPFNPTDMANVQPALSFNTAVSFMTNTNWQWYGGETTMSHLTQMVGLDGAELRVGGGRHGGDGGADPRPRPPPGSARSATSGSTCPARPCASCCRCRSCSRSCSSPGRDPELPRASPRCTRVDGRRRRRSPAARSPARVDQAARHERRRLLQHQLGAPVREPDAVHQLPRALRDPDHPVRARVHLRAHGQGQAPGLRRVRRHGRDLAGVSASARSSLEVDGNPKLDARRRRPGGHRRARRAATLEGKEVRFGPAASGAVGGVDDRHVERLGQLHARQLHAARRHDRRWST